MKIPLSATGRAITSSRAFTQVLFRPPWRLPRIFRGRSISADCMQTAEKRLPTKTILYGCSINLSLFLCVLVAIWPQFGTQGSGACTANSVLTSITDGRSDAIAASNARYKVRSSFSYSAWGPIQNQTTVSPFKTPTARQSKSMRTE